MSILLQNISAKIEVQLKRLNCVYLLLTNVNEWFFVFVKMGLGGYTDRRSQIAFIYAQIIVNID